MALITTEDLENAKLDAVSLGQFVNNDQVVTTRTAATYDSIRRTLNAINSVTRAYATETALLADLTPVDKTLGYALNTEKFYIKSGGTGTGSWSAGAYASIKGSNILYDTWNKKTQNSLNLGGWNWYRSITPSFTTARTNIATDTPKVAVTGTIFDKQWDISKLNLKDGDTISIGALVWSETVKLRLVAYIKNSSDVITSTFTPSYDTGTGARIITNQFVIPADSDKSRLHLRVQAQSSVAFEIGAISAAVGNYLAPFTELDAFTDYEKVALGVTAIETKTNNITVTQAVNLDAMESDILSAKTKTDHLTISAPANIGTMQSDITSAKTKTDNITVTQAVNLDAMESDIATLQSQIGVSPNIFPDVFGDTLTNERGISLYDTARPSFTNRLLNSVNNPFPNKSSLQGVGTANVWRYIKYDGLGIRNGEDFRVRVQAHYAGTGSIIIDLRNSAGTVLQSFTQAPVSSGVASLVDYLSPAFQGRSDAFEILVRVQSSSGNNRELIAIAIGKGTASPAILNAPNDINTLRTLSNAKNLIPDPFFRRFNAGETAIDGYTLGTTSWTMVDYASSPFKVRKAQFFNTNGFSERLINVNRLGLKLGKTYKVGVGVIAPAGGSLGIAVYFRNTSNGATYGGTADTDYTLSDGVYAEVYEAITITQEMLDNPVVLVIRHNTNLISFAGGYNVCGWFIYESLDQELIDDEFAFDTLASRVTTLENSLTEIPYEYNKFSLRETKQRLQKLKLAETEQLKIAIHGTSTTQLGTRYMTPLTTELMSEYGDAGGGWLGFGFTATPTSNGNVRSSIYTYARTGAWTSNYFRALSADLSTVESGTAGARLTIAGPAGTPILSGIDLHWVATANGVIRYSWNGGSSWTTLNVQGTLETVNITNLIGHPTTGNFSLLIEVVSGSVILSGLNIKSTASGVQVHKLGNSGGRLQHLAEINNTEWIKTIINLAPNVFFLFHGGNDQDVGRTPIQFADNLRTVIDRIKAALPACDIGIIMPPAVVEPRTTPLILYTAEALKVAKEKKIAFIDLQRVFGDDPSEYSSTSPRPWFNADDIHPEPTTGGRAIVSALYRLIKY